jgi:hypothetical protein
VRHEPPENPPKQAYLSAAEISDGVYMGMWGVPSAVRWRDDLELSDYDQGTPDSGPWLVAEGDYEKRYGVVRKRALFDDAVRVGKAPTMDAIERFASKYGLLGQDYERWVRPIGGGTVTRATSLHTWQTEMQTVAALWALWQGVRVGRAGWLADFVRWTGPGQQRAGPVSITISVLEVGAAPRRAIYTRQRLKKKIGPFFTRQTVRTLAREVHDPSELLHIWKPGAILEPMKYYIHERVNDALDGKVNMAVMPLLGSVVRYVPANLLAAVYMQFAFRLAARQLPERDCPHCRQRFTPARRNQLSCTKQCRDNASYHRRADHDAAHST